MGNKNNQTTGNSTAIDSLTLNIEVKGADSVKSVSSLSTAISRLNENLKAFDNAKFSKTFENMAKGIEPFVNKIESVSSALESLATIVKKSGLDKAVEQVSGKMPEIKTEDVQGGGGEGKSIQAIGVTAERLKEIQQMTSVTDVLRSQLTQIQEKMENQNLSEEQLLKLKKQELKLTEQIAKADKKTEKKASPLGKLVKSFGRIAMYRAVRRTIQEITQAFTESIDGIARYNSEFRDTMGSLQSSINKTKTSIGVAFYQTLIVLEPVITSISNGIVHLSNGLSYLTAKLRGSSTYMKINTEYMKEYQSAVQGTLLSFDTFETLSGSQGIDYSKMFEEVETAGSSFGEELGNIKNILIEISGILLAIGGYKIAKWIEDGGIKKLKDGLGGIKGKIDDISTAGLIAGASFAFLASIANLIDVIKNWDSQSLVTKITAITSAILGVAAVIFSILAAIPGIGGAKVLKAIAVGATALSVVAGMVSAAKFADGGMMTNASGQFAGAGTMYAIAGESGAEVVATGSAGTGVLNVDQFADAMVSALVRYGAARDTSNGTTIVLDGNKVGQLVASNVGFRNEANRRNAGLNWK